ncbi:hypothetical protein BLOT_007334 [Blomia tropicalis]|nr:hypothetical protein BLOT_007334 [Blomia tropicalis]
MPQCLSPQFESKSPAIVELLNSTAEKCRLEGDKLQHLNQLSDDYESDTETNLNRLLSVNKSFVLAENTNRRINTSELDDFVYLEFFVDTIKPEYASLHSTNVTFTNCPLAQIGVPSSV